MVQGNDSLEVTLESHLNNCASSFDDHHDNMDAHALNEELSEFCENLLSKYKLLKSKSFELIKEIKIYFQNLTPFYKRGLRFKVKGIPWKPNSILF